MYPRYARSERIADGTVHAVGVTGALIGALVLIPWAIYHVAPGQLLALTIYAAAMVASFAASAFYHMTPWERLRPMLRRLDHAAIYLKIAGSYTPLVVFVGNSLSYAVLAIVWLMALWGIVRKLFFWQRPGRFSTALYLIMGWMGVTVIWMALPVLPAWSSALIATGGVLYTLGVVFFNWESLKFSMAIWHGFVLVASAMIFVAISVGAAAAV